MENHSQNEGESHHASGLGDEGCRDNDHLDQLSSMDGRGVSRVDTGLTLMGDEEGRGKLER